MTPIRLSTLSLFPATADQVIESRRRNAEEWARGLSLDDYLARDAFTDAKEVSRNGRLITWILAPRDNPTSLEFMCSCETFRRSGLIWPSSLPQNNGKPSSPEKVICYGIASVFTPPRFRRHGYAQHMMRLLHWVIADDSYLPKVFPEEWGTPPLRVPNAGDGRFSALWSDVGHFYQRCGPTDSAECGWIVRGAVSTIWDIPSQNISAGSEKWTWLGEDGCKQLWEMDSGVIENTASPSTGHQVSFTFLPHNGVAAFQYWRMMPYLDKSVDLQHWGIKSQSNSPNGTSNVFATWTYQVRPPDPKTLLITRLSCRPDDFERLFAMLVEIARTHGLEKLEVYNLPDNLQPVAMAFGGATRERDEHLSAFKWYGPEDPQDISWLYNEKWSQFFAS